MPTLYKPILTEAQSVWSTTAKAISDRVVESRSDILERLNFHAEHGRLGEADGKFDEQIKRFEDEVLAEISGILTFAAAQAAEPRTGVIVATLEWIQKHPSAAQDYALPGFAEWLLALHYQRASEDTGTYFPDIMGFVPDGFHDTIQIPGKENIAKAASAAIDDLSQGRRTGRPSSDANRIAGEGLREVFLRYNDKITRCSETRWRNREYIQVEAGPFFDFVSAAIVPLRTFLRERGLPPVTVDSIVRHGRYPDSPIRARFNPGVHDEHAPEARQPAATENDHEKSNS